MLAFPGMLVPSCKSVGMSFPDNVCDKDFELDSCKEKYPHFFVFCQLQLCRRMNDPGEAFENAKLIVKIPLKKLMKMTLEDFLRVGLKYST